MRLFLLLFVTICFSQNKQSFYFDFNKSSFNLSQEENFNNWLNANPTAKVIRVEGYCDYVGSNEYNIQLAKKRINFILDKLKIQKVVSKSMLKPFGEDFKQDSIQDLNRRVDVYYKLNDQTLDEFITTNSSGKSIVLKNLNFYNNSGEVLPDSKPVLEELLTIMNKYSKLKIEIQGHICCQSIYEADKIEDIAKVRALAVYVFLINNGIEENRLSYKSFKSQKPLYSIPEKNEEQRIANRRVEIMILEN
ncbi:OmpA family protein [uncultured Flavobacterium sp.]|uniref:OmpA family protein n=1 Tax=uncultured Flavobacterium sp. TaxID=165435 RepID=UPI0030ECD4AB|tara:strand:- start:8242 stop:8988 length:747 start_codon:yes stop_codon:yes gene_type:complete